MVKRNNGIKARLYLQSFKGPAKDGHAVPERIRMYSCSEIDRGHKLCISRWTVFTQEVNKVESITSHTGGGGSNGS